MIISVFFYLNLHELPVTTVVSFEFYPIQRKMNRVASLCSTIRYFTMNKIKKVFRSRPRKFQQRGGMPMRLQRAFQTCRNTLSKYHTEGSANTLNVNTCTCQCVRPSVCVCVHARTRLAWYMFKKVSQFRQTNTPTYEIVTVQERLYNNTGAKLLCTFCRT